ncbi:MAG: hypothetical protein JW864_07580 [Spirochaetes bacterium]|nr:hypothetical protein [Spirochaetota bacterium]
MKTNNLKQRIFTTKTLYPYLKNMIESLYYLKNSKFSGEKNKSLTENIMPAVTEINNIRYSKYFYHRPSLNDDVSKEDIQALFEGRGQFEDNSHAEPYALKLLQHYAYGGSDPDPETYHKLCYISSCSMLSSFYI